MTERIVDFLDALVATVGAIDERYCLVEKREMPYNGQSTNIPYKYVGNGNYRPVEVDGGSVSYWRLVNNISFDVVDGNSAIKNLQATYPIRYVAMVKRDTNNPLVFSQDVANILEGRNKDLQTQLQAKNVNITVNSIDTDTPKIWGEEFTMPLKEPDYKRSLVMLDITVTVIAKRECWQDCDNYPDILAGFPWCEDTAATVARLTEEQQDCLFAELCGNPDPVTEQINGVTIGTSASGTTNNQVIENTLGTPVGTSANPSVVPDGNVENSNASYTATVASGGTLVLPNITFTDSDGSTSSVPSVQDITATPCTSPSLSIEVYSDAGYTIPASSFNFGATAYIKLVPTGITPTSYTLFFGNGTKNAPQVTQAGDTLAWTVSLTGSVIISATATDGSDATADATPFTLTSTLVIDHALKFDGVNDYAVSGLPKIDLANFSISFVFQLNSTAGRTSLYSFASLNPSPGQPAQGMYYESNAFTFLSQSAYSFGQTLPWTGDTDAHVFTMRYNSTVRAVEIFIDGVSLGVCAQLATYSTAIWSLVLGRAYVFTNYGNVKLTDVRVFNHYLSIAEIATLQTLGNPVGNEVLWYPFTEAIGTTTVAKDLLTGYELAMYNMTAPNGIIAWP